MSRESGLDLHRPSNAALRAATVCALVSMAGLLGSHGVTALAHDIAALGVAPNRQVETFQAAMEEAMRRMDAGMTVPPTGDPDRDFARMMIPHHQGAVDMALAELRYGRDERLRRLAQGIIVEQRQEIELMRNILDGTPSSHPVATQPGR
jgi:uncharacterized protein (DUF305 family)